MSSITTISTPTVHSMKNYIHLCSSTIVVDATTNDILSIVKVYVPDSSTIDESSDIIFIQKYPLSENDDIKTIYTDVYLNFELIPSYTYSYDVLQPSRNLNILFVHGTTLTHNNFDLVSLYTLNEANPIIETIHTDNTITIPPSHQNLTPILRATNYSYIIEPNLICKPLYTPEALKIIKDIFNMDPE